MYLQISKLSLLAGTKSVGDSVCRLMVKMFDDQVLLHYYLQGFKKKKCFHKLAAYRLLIGKLVFNKRSFLNKAIWKYLTNYKYDFLSLIFFVKLYVGIINIYFYF